MAKGGGLADITVGDALEYVTVVRESGRTRSGGGSTLFYSWLRQLGHLPADAPMSLRLLCRVTGQLTCEQLVDRHGVANAPIRGLLIDYLEERRHRLDYSTLDNLARLVLVLAATSVQTVFPQDSTDRLTWWTNRRAHRSRRRSTS
ncbi:hypothetical protein ACFVRB_27235 [Streptomyces nojiriensis]|uniref:hypothetical protein n=1 Tax=Streptomyces nojiriensis TaxID=66374 RepID=UPI0036DF7E86